MPSSSREHLRPATQGERGRTALLRFTEQLADSAPRQRAVAHGRLGRLLEQSQDVESARRAYAQSVTFDPALKAPGEALSRLGRK